MIIDLMKLYYVFALLIVLSIATETANNKPAIKKGSLVLQVKTGE